MTSISKLEKGEWWEFRVQRAVFVSGWHSRRGVNLRERVAGSPQTMAEVDIFGLAFDASLTPRRLIAECKNRKGGAKEADRVVWLLGLKEILKADHVLFAKPAIAEGTYAWSRGFDVMLWDEASVRRTEQRHSLDPSEGYVGSFDPTIWSEALPSIRGVCGTSPELRRAWDYLSGLFWYAENTARTKRLPAYFAAVASASDLSVPARRLLEVQGLLALLVAALTTAGQLLRSSPARGKASMVDAFSAGVASAPALREIAARADDYYRDALRKATAGGGKARQPVAVPKLSDNIAQPPIWVADYLELCQHLAEAAVAPTDLVRFADLVLHERFVSRRDTDISNFLGAQEADVIRVVRLLGYFAKRVWGIEALVIEDLLAAEPNGTSPSETGTAQPTEQVKQMPFDRV